MIKSIKKRLNKIRTVKRLKKIRAVNKKAKEDNKKHD